MWLFKTNIFHMNKYLFSTFSVVVFCAMFLITVNVNANTEKFACDLHRDIDIGVEGEDVLCLQIFLNKTGYKLAEDGPGSLGKETTRFGALTRDALSR